MSGTWSKLSHTDPVFIVHDCLLVATETLGGVRGEL